MSCCCCCNNCILLMVVVIICITLCIIVWYICKTIRIIRLKKYDMDTLGNLTNRIDALESRVKS